MSSGIAHTAGVGSGLFPVRSERAPRGLDATLSSTTPDVGAHAPFLATGRTLATTTLAGAAAGVLLRATRFPGVGGGALLGAAAGVAVLGIDRLAGGSVKRLVDAATLDRRHELAFVLANPTKPWLATFGLHVARDARDAQLGLFGTREPKDGPQDAFRHSYAAALFTLRAMRDHGLSAPESATLALAAGEAHEQDGQDNNDSYSRSMDEANNAAGTMIVGDGRARAGEEADARGFITEAALRDRILAAMAAGSLTMVDRPRGTTPYARPSVPADVPATDVGSP